MERMAGVKPASPARYGRRVPLNPSCACSPTEKAICGILRRSAFSSTAGATSTYQKQSSPAYHLRVIPARARYARYYLLPHAHFFEKTFCIPFFGMLSFPRGIYCSAQNPEGYYRGRGGSAPPLLNLYRPPSHRRSHPRGLETRRPRRTQIPH